VENQSSGSEPSLIKLFLSFLRLGATAFGGPAMIAYIRRMAVEQKNGWTMHLSETVLHYARWCLALQPCKLLVMSV